MQTLLAPRNGVTDLTFSPDGDILAGIANHAVRCWHRSRGWEPSGLWHEGTVTGLAFHPNGRTLAYAACLRFDRVTNDPERFTGIRFHPLGETAEFKPEIMPLNPEGVRVPSLDQWFRGLAFAPNGDLFSCRLVSPSMFGAPRVIVQRWNFDTNGPAWERRTEVAATEFAAPGGVVMPDPAHLVMAGAWGVRVFPAQGDPEAIHARSVAGCSAVAVAPAAELAACAENERFVVWSLREASRIATVPVPSMSVTAIALAQSGEMLATGHADGTVALWSLRTGERQSGYDFRVGAVQSLAFAPDGLTLAVAGRKGLVVFDVE